MAPSQLHGYLTTKFKKSGITKLKYGSGRGIIQIRDSGGNVISSIGANTTNTLNKTVSVNEEIKIVEVRDEDGNAGIIKLYNLNCNFGGNEVLKIWKELNDTYGYINIKFKKPGSHDLNYGSDLGTNGVVRLTEQSYVMIPSRFSSSRFLEKYDASGER